MNRENTQLLYRKFPLLYHHKNPFEHADGWFQIVYDLSAILEPLIEKWIVEHPDSPCQCSCPRDKHATMTTGRQETVLGCFAVDLVAFSPNIIWTKWGFLRQTEFNNIYHRAIYLYDYGSWKLKKKIQKLSEYLVTRFKIGRRKPCLCTQYYSNHPAAVQIKEKYGTLRFYMSCTEAGMGSPITNVEGLSSITCEECSAPGVLRQTSWLRTLCNTHANGALPYNA